MVNRDIKNQDWYKDLKIKNMTDFSGHYVEMKSVDNNKKVWWIWNDGAITNEGFKRDLLFNFLFFVINTYRHHKFLIKFCLICLILLSAYLIIF